MPSRNGGSAPQLTARSAVPVAFASGVAGVAGSFALAGFTPAFVAGPIAGFLARRLPPGVITAAIVVLGDLGSRLNVAGAVLTAVLALSLCSLIGLAVALRTGRPLAGPVVGAVLCALVAVGITRAPLASAAGGLSSGVVLAAPLLSVRWAVPALSEDRRRVLGSVSSALAFVFGGYVLGERATRRRTETEAAPLDTDASLLQSTGAALDLAERKSLDVEGLEGLVSDGFYEVDINATNPTVDAEEWSLTITGEVEQEVTYSYEDLRSMDAENRFVTLRCVGETLNGKKLDNALWTGVPITDLFETAVPEDTCCVMLRATDGYYQEFPLSALEDGMVAYGMNGHVLPRAHGYPVRALVPGHWGEVNVKWLSEIEVLESEQTGYWEKRGWHGTGPVNTVAKIHAVNDLEDGRKRLGGHAYAGTRGVGGVQVSTDGGDTWHDAEVSDPLPGDDVWRQWAYTYDPPDGSHWVIARAIEADGTVQPEERSGPFPRGASGWVQRKID